MGDNPWDDLFDLAEDVRDIANEHDDKIRSLFGKENKIYLRDSEPLVNANKTDDRVLVELEIVDADGVADFSFKYNEQKNQMKVVSPTGTISFMLPDDVDMDNIEASFNNGILSLDIPRVSKDIDVNVIDERDGDDGGEE